MRVVFLEDVPGVAQGGDVKDVKNGFARNYLIPKSLALPATHNALQRVERLKNQSDGERVKRLANMKALAEELDGVQVNVEMRSGPGGRLYGSVTNAIIAEELSKLTAREIDRRTIHMEEPIRELGVFEFNARLHPEVEARIKVLVYEMGTEPVLPEEAEAEEGEEAEVTLEEGQAVDVAELESEPAEIEDDAADSKEDTPEAEEDVAETEDDAADSKEDTPEAEEDVAETEDDAADSKEDTSEAEEEVAEIEDDTVDSKEDTPEAEEDTDKSQ